MSRLATDTAIASAEAARERNKSRPSTAPSKVPDPHIPSKRDRLTNARHVPDIPTELDHTSGQRPRPASGHDPPDGGRPMSVTQWCAYVGISRTAYYAAKRLGNAPDELHVGNRRLITPEAHARWCRKHTHRARRQTAEPA